MQEALATAFHSVSLTLLAALPQQQQLILCTLVLRMRRLLQDVNGQGCDAATKAAWRVGVHPSTERASEPGGCSSSANFGAELLPSSLLLNNASKRTRAHVEERKDSSISYHLPLPTCADSSSFKASATGAPAESAALAKHDKCTIGILAADYERLCAKQRLMALRPTQVYSLCESLAVCGLVGIGGSGRAGSQHRRSLEVDPLARTVWLCISQEDLRTATDELRAFNQLLT
jgi:Cdc6-like AAA superfamily ATPase